jgi:RNA polymerase sigma factor (sigma-70 family)
VPPARDAVSEYRRLLSTLASRARYLGSRDPESAAQESLKRSLDNAESRQAVEYYFSQDPPAGMEPPGWPLDRLFAWLHAVLHYVVREEQSRASRRHEVGQLAENGRPDWADPAPNPLDTLIQKELQGIVVECLPTLDREYRDVLNMRVHGLKYEEIALRLGVNENTVATWISRGIRELAQRVRKRTAPFTRPPRGARG